MLFRSVSQSRYVAFIVIDKQISTCNPAYFDNLVVPAKHPNIVSHLRGTNHQTMSYVMKDGNYKSFPPEFDIHSYMNTYTAKPKAQAAPKERKVPMSHQVAAMIEEGATLAQIDDQFPYYVMTHLAPLQRYLEYRDWETDRKSTRLNSSHRSLSRMPSSA